MMSIRGGIIIPERIVFQNLQLKSLNQVPVIKRIENVRFILLGALKIFI